VGLDVDPDDGSWLSISRLNRETMKTEKRGEVLITVEILPKTAAELLPAGLGRSEPNLNPYLPPPTGRLKLV
jgi:hypothetical protein